MNTMKHIGVMIVASLMGVGVAFGAEGGARAADPNIAITPTTRNFETGGGAYAIVTSGSGTWNASASDSWITLNATSGAAGYPVAYAVSATTNVEPRTGYVYVSGHTHTVTQDGLGGSIDPDHATFEWNGGNGEIAVTAPERIGWQARANCDWLSVGQPSGTGPGTLTYTVTRFDEVNTRQGTLTVAGNTFTVFQYGRRMKLAPTSATYDYLTHVIPITVDALAITEWDVELNNSWISVVDGGKGKGSDLVTIAIGENPSWKARTGTVRIGTETFTVTQNGRTAPALEFAIEPESTTASVEGANGLIAVTATPDLPWTAVSQANWLTIFPDFTSGAGNGNVAYTVSPNSTLYERTGKIKVTPGDANVAAKTHTVTQPAAISALSMNGYEFEAAGESCEVRVSLADIVEWQIQNKNAWLTVVGETNRLGPGTVTLQAAPNDTVYPRSGTVTIARKTFKVSQKARGVEVEYETKLFGTDGGYESISIHPDGQVSWTAVASDPTWITIYGSSSGTGDGEVLYIVSPYVGTGEARTGTITVGDKVVYITQRAYDLSIDPTGSWVAGNNGVGEFAVSASIDAVWTAIVTEPWITIIEGYDAGTGNGIVRFAYMDNDTGKPRVGKIIVAGEVYTLQQRERQLVAITTDAEHGGTVAGAGSYDLGTTVTLTAVPGSGYAFSYWTGDVESMENPLVFTADVPKSVTAVFEALPIEFEQAESTEEGVWLGWNNLAWATTYRIFRGVTSVPSSAEVLAEIPNTGMCEWLDETGEVEVEYWYWIEAEGVEDDVTSDPMTGMKLKPIIISPIVYENLMGAENPNPATYQEETTVTFEAPGPVEGYTFAGWTPPQITADMTGTQTVTAAWTANRYLIAYDPNGGSGTMEPTLCTWDQEAGIAGNEFTRWGWRFAGWATAADGEAVWSGGETVSNLTAQSEGVVTLFATWQELEVATPEITPPDGTVFLMGPCEVSIACATEGAAIYYTTDGTTPRVHEAFLYEGPFELADSATVQALAVLEGVRSGYAEATLTRRVLSLAEAAGAAQLAFATGGDAEWKAIVDGTSKSGFSAECGVVGNDGESWMEATVEGAGTLQFTWKVDCERDESGAATWDHLAVVADGEEAGRIDGTTDWLTERIAFGTDGEHSVRWAFERDHFDAEEGEAGNRAWVRSVIWAPRFEAEGVYDGEGHGLDAAAIASAFGEGMEGESVVEYAATGEGGTETAPEEGWSATPPVFTNAGEAATWYRVTNANYEDFAEWAMVRVAARPVQVLVAGRLGTFGYDGTEKIVEGWSAATKDELYDVEASVQFAGTAAEARRTDAGKTAMGLTAEDFTNTDANFAVEFLVDDGWVEVTAADISEGEGFEMEVGANPTYDGTEQSVEVTSATWQGLPVTFEVSGNSAIHAGAYELTVTATGNFSGTRTAEWAVLPRAVTLESASATKRYDGTALAKDEVAVAEGSLGFADGDGFTAVCTGSQTAVGSSENTFGYELSEGTLAGDYEIATVFGSLEVTLGVIDPAAVFGGDGQVTCEKVYNGSEQAFEMAVEFGEPWQVLYAAEDGEEYGETPPTLAHVADGEMAVAFRFVSANYEAYDGTAAFRIAPKELAEEMLVLGEELFFRDEEGRKLPAAVVLDVDEAGAAICSTNDYDLAFGETTGEGLVPVIATGRNDYAGTVTKELPLLKWSVEPPAIEAAVYNGEVQTAAVPEDERWEVAENAGGVEAGEYAVVLRLVNAEDWEWQGSEDGGADWTGTFAITRADNEWVVMPGMSSWTQGEDPAEATGQARFGAMSVGYRERGAAVENETGEPPTAAGLYVARFWVEGTASYAGLGLEEPCEAEFEVFAPTGDETTQTTGVPVPHSWLEPYVENYGGGDYEVAGNAVGKNGYALWESYLAGLDPDNPASRFTVKMKGVTDGVPDLEWDPDLSEDLLPRAYNVRGAAELGAEPQDWTPVTPENIREMRYFAVEVKFAD